jgi:lactoylglutathione lyase
LSYTQHVKVERHGLILFTENYERCVAFYQRVLALSIWFAKPELTCFRFGSSYLMVERGGVGCEREKPRNLSPIALRLNVADIEVACAALRARGVDSPQITQFPWGEIVHFLDPDGNSIQLCAWPSAEEIPAF